MSDFDREKFSINDTKTFIKHVRLELEDQLHLAEREKNVLKDTDEKEALFFKRLNYFIEKTEQLMKLVDLHGDQFMKMSPKDLYETFLSLIKIDESLDFSVQNARLKLACLRLIEAREVVLKYAPIAKENPKLFVQNEIIPDHYQLPKGFVERLLESKIKGAKINPKLFCLEVQLKPKDYKKLTGYNPDIYGAMAFGVTKNPELNQRVYLTSMGNNQEFEDIQHHEEMHIVYWTFVNGDHIKPLFNPVEMPHEKDALDYELKALVAGKSDYYLNLLQTEFISNASRSTPVVYSRLFEYGVDVYMSELAGIAQFIVKNQTFSSQDKESLMAFIEQTFTDYLQKSRQYVKSARALFRYSTLSHLAIIALLLSVPADKISSVVDHYIQKGVQEFHPNPLWHYIEKDLMGKGHLRWGSYDGSTKRAPNMEANNTYEEEAWEEVNERLVEWLDEIKRA